MDKIDSVVELVVRSKKMVMLTGAGMSTESGISDFRSPGGLWSQFNPLDFTYQKFLESEAARERFWEFSRTLWPNIVNAQPNRGHYAVTELNNLGKLDCLITQNVDGLHQKAGLPAEKIIELHGTARIVACLQCGKKYPREEIQTRLEAGERVPRCDCGGLLKSATVSFGQPIPEERVKEAEARAAGCDLFLAVGSSLEVFPAARLPVMAKENGARLVVINLSTTRQDRRADIVINEKIGDVLPLLTTRVGAKTS